MLLPVCSWCFGQKNNSSIGRMQHNSRIIHPSRCIAVAQKVKNNELMGNKEKVGFLLHPQFNAQLNAAADAVGGRKRYKGLLVEAALLMAFGAGRDRVIELIGNIEAAERRGAIEDLLTEMTDPTVLNSADAGRIVDDAQRRGSRRDRPRKRA